MSALELDIKGAHRSDSHQYPVYLMPEPAYLACHAIGPASSAWIVGGALGTSGGKAA